MDCRITFAGFGIVVLLLGIVVSISQHELIEFTTDVSALMEEVNLKNTLKYNEHCNYALEQKRQQFGIELVNSLNQLGRITDDTQLKGFMESIKANIRSLTRLEGSLCTAHENLQCFAEGYCACAIPDKSLGFKINFTRDGNGCLYAKGSICVPEDAHQTSNPFSLGTPKYETRCAHHSTCVLKTDGDVCTMENLAKSLKTTVGEHFERDATPEQLVEYYLQKAKEGYCVCAGDSIFASLVLVLLSLISIKSIQSLLS